MYWPPRWTPNNSVAVSDDKWLIDNPGDPRFETYTQTATVIAPWMAWADIDSRWPANDPICRILLIGEPGSTLKSVNQDTVGSIITLGTANAGLQRWEVVSYFDWYVDENLQKEGCICWCRLWDGVTGGGVALEVLEVVNVEEWNNTGDDDGSFDILVGPEDGLIVIWIATNEDGGPVVSATLDGEAMTSIRTVEIVGPPSLYGSAWMGRYDETNPGLLTINLTGAGVAQGIWYLVKGVAEISVNGYDSDENAEPDVIADSNTDAADTMAFAFLACTDELLTNEWDPPWGDQLSFVGDVIGDVLGGVQILDSIQQPHAVVTGITPTMWVAVCFALKPE